VSVYPNPCKDVITVKSENVVCKVVIRIFRQVIRNISWSGQTEMEIDLSSETSGLYFIGIYTEDGLQSSKLIKTE
jgi:hypothetical protein